MPKPNIIGDDLEKFKKELTTLSIYREFMYVFYGFHLMEIKRFYIFKCFICNIFVLMKFCVILGQYTMATNMESLWNVSIQELKITIEKLNECVTITIKVLSILYKNFLKSDHKLVN